MKKSLRRLGRLPTSQEIEYADFALSTPHYVLSNTLDGVRWANTTVLRDAGDLVVLRQKPGKTIYVVGGAQTVSGLLDRGLIDELRLTVHPLVVGEGKALFATVTSRHRLRLGDAKSRADGTVSLVYTVGD